MLSGPARVVDDAQILREFRSGKMRDAVGAVTFGPEDAESLADELDSLRRLEEWLSDTDR